jgi:hypothetical protein
MMFADAERAEPDLIGAHDLLDQIADAIRGGDDATVLPGVGVDHRLQPAPATLGVRVSEPGRLPA